MGEWAHRLSEVDRETMRGVCKLCGPVRVYRTGPGRNVRCKTAHDVRQQRYRQPRQARRKLVKDTCEWCGFVCVDLCQMDIDHKDGDWRNDDPSNLWTLCVVCHRLKTHRPELFWAQKHKKTGQAPARRQGPDTET